MTKFIRLYFLCYGILAKQLFTVLQTVELNINSEDNSEQQEFRVVEKTLTVREARAQKRPTRELYYRMGEVEGSTYS